MESLSEHLRYLGRKYELLCNVDALTDREISLLGRYGSWLEALAAGLLEPTTKAQKAFIMVHQCTAPPRTEFELTWHKYQVERIFELAQRLEANLCTRGEIQYWQLHEVYRKAAFLGHGDAIFWIEAQGDAGPAPSPIDGLDLSIPDVRPLEQNSTVTTGSSRASLSCPSSGDTDWGISFDDMDSAAWEQHLGGP